MISDLRLAIRTLSKSPAFAFTAAAALALGIGANTTIFSVVNQVMLNPAGVDQPSRVVAERVRYDKLALKSIGVSAPDFKDAQNSTQVFEAAAILEGGSFNYTTPGGPEKLDGASVSADYFRVFGAKPRLGRTFLPAEDQPNANQVAVLSFAAWKRLFGQDAGIIGRTIQLNETPYRVVGVMGPQFRYPTGVELWVPLGLPASGFDARNRFNESYLGVARLKPGASFEQASSLMNLLSDRLKNGTTRYAAYGRDAAWGMFIVPITDFIAGKTKTPLLVLLGAVGFVLLIACSNIAGLMLARSSGRAREVAVRAALGATRWHLVRQVMAESLVLSLGGAIAGLALAYGGVQGIVALAPATVPIALDVRLDPFVLFFTAGAAIAAGLLFGIAPAWQMSRLDRYEALREGGRAGTAGLARQRMRAGLVMGEVAIALVLLAGAGLFLRSLASLENVNPGFEPAGIITGSVALPHARYSEDARQVEFYRAVLDGLATVPGVTNVAVATSVPFSNDDGSASFEIEGRPSPAGDPGPHGDIALASPGYFGALKIALRRGRVFSDHDIAGSESVALVDETLAKQYWPNQDAVGQHIRNGSKEKWATIVGVVEHVKNSDLAGDQIKGRYYYPMYQQPFRNATLVVRTQGDPDAATGAIRAAVGAVDPSEPISQLRTMSGMVAASLAPRRFVVTMLAIFAGLALLMAVIGLYGVTSYSVAQRTQEIGIRMALGARRGEILSMVIRQGMWLTGGGVLMGLAAALALSQLLRSQLFQVSPFDPLTFGLTAVVLIAAELAACSIPAQRATRVDPMEALRHE
jgi:predicted permease